jgi:hypothetical protein
LRDHGNPCISCGHPDDGSRQRHASHFRPATIAALRFDPANVHASCSICNNWKSGNLTPYATALIEKVGQAEVDRLNGPQPAMHRTVEEIREIAAHDRKLIREIEKQREAAA